MSQTTTKQTYTHKCGHEAKLTVLTGQTRSMRTWAEQHLCATCWLAQGRAITAATNAKRSARHAEAEAYWAEKCRAN